MFSCDIPHVNLYPLLCQATPQPALLRHALFFNACIPLLL